VWKKSDVGYYEVLFEQLSEEQQLLKAIKKTCQYSQLPNSKSNTPQT
jgi:hypothetical protein